MNLESKISHSKKLHISGTRPSLKLFNIISELKGIVFTIYWSKFMPFTVFMWSSSCPISSLNFYNLSIFHL